VLEDVLVTLDCGDAHQLGVVLRAVVEDTLNALLDDIEDFLKVD